MTEQIFSRISMAESDGSSSKGAPAEPMNGVNGDVTSDSPDWPAPLCLVESTQDGKLKVNPDTLSRLQQVTRPVVVVGVVGLYRTGKSYLLNLLAGKQSGFLLGSTVQSQTKGIWAWVQPHPKREDWSIVLLDTEGLGDAEKGDPEHDTWIFVLTVLLSSTLIYNSLGTIDQGAMDNIHFVTELADHVKIRSSPGDEETEYNRLFPNFVWAVRDFTLDLELDGQATDADGYLENALKLRPGAGRRVLEYNLPRECIRGYFPTRRCFCFPHPVEKRSQLQNLESLNFDDLDTDFRKVSGEFFDYIHSVTGCKTIASKATTGRMLGHLVDTYVTSILQGSVPCIESALETTAHLENTRALEESVKLYVTTMQSTLKLPTSTIEEMSGVHSHTEQEAIKTFLSLAFFDKDQEFQQQMMIRIQDEYEGFLKLNEEASVAQCQALLSQLHHKIGDNLQNGAYAQPGGYSWYKADMDQIISSYEASPNRGVKAQEVLQEFITKHEAEGAAILKMDEKLTEEDRIREEERKRAEALEQERKALEEEKQRAQKLIEDQERTFEENKQQLMAKFEAEKQAILQEAEVHLERRMAEQQKLMEQGFDDKARLMEREILQLKTALEKQDTSGVLSFLGKVVKSGFGLFPLFKKVKSAVTGKKSMDNRGQMLDDQMDFD